MAAQDAEVPWDEQPLIAFSAYTQIQVDVLHRLGRDIRRELDEAFADSRFINSLHFNRAYGYFWLWVLGSYEVVRTMDGAPGCFSTRAQASIGGFKRRVAELRMPFAKQQYRGMNTPIEGEASVRGIRDEEKDFEFEVRGQVFSVRRTLADFEGLIAAISKEDVLRDLRESTE